MREKNCGKCKGGPDAGESYTETYGNSKRLCPGSEEVQVNVS
jgi:hypothetical protein